MDKSFETGLPKSCWQACGKSSLQLTSHEFRTGVSNSFSPKGHMNGMGPVHGSGQTHRLAPRSGPGDHCRTVTAWPQSCHYGVLPHQLGAPPCHRAVQYCPRVVGSYIWLLWGCAACGSHSTTLWTFAWPFSILCMLPMGHSETTGSTGDWMIWPYF